MTYIDLFAKPSLGNELLVQWETPSLVNQWLSVLTWYFFICCRMTLRHSNTLQEEQSVNFVRMAS